MALTFDGAMLLVGKFSYGLTMAREKNIEELNEGIDLDPESCIPQGDWTENDWFPKFVSDYIKDMKDEQGI